VRLANGLSQGTYSGSITHAGGGAPAASVSVNGEVGYPVNLQPGQLAIIGFRSVANDGIAFTAWVDMPAGTTILFTDRAWTGTELLTNENLAVWQNTTGQAIAAGTVVKIGGPEFGNGEGTNLGTLLSGNLNGLAQGGDNIFAVQGSLSNPAWVYGLTYVNDWITQGTVTNGTSYLPAALNVAGANIYINGINAQYDDARTGEAAILNYRTLVHITDNWTINADGVAFGDFNTEPFVAAPPACNVNGGTVASTSPRNNLCVGDGISNIVSVTVSGNSGVGRFGLVRQSDLAVITTNTSGNFNMENFPPGAYFVGYVAVENLQQLNGVTNINQLSGCFSLSNQLAVTSVLVSGGTIVATTPTSGCVNTASFTVSGQAGTTFRWALLNQNGTQLLDQNTTGTFNLSALPNGTYRVVHVASRGVNLATVVPPNLPACVAASNQITINKNCPAAITSSPNPTTGTSWVTFTVAEDQPAAMEVFDMSGRKVAELFRADARANVEYRLEFNGNALPNGVYVYRLTTTGNTVVEKFVISR
jgi:predicted secreted protein